MRKLEYIMRKGIGENKNNVLESNHIFINSHFPCKGRKWKITLEIQGKGKVWIDHKFSFTNLWIWIHKFLSRTS